MSKPTRTRISRRTLLRGAGHIAIGLPLLEAMGCDDPVRAARQPGQGGLVTPRAGTPRRLLVFFVPNGTIPPLWFPQGGTETEFDLPPLLQPLEAFRDRMVVFSGVHNTAASLGAEDNHNEGMTSLLTGWHAYKLKSEFDPNNIPGDAPRIPLGVSLDQYLASIVGLQTPRRSLAIGTEWYHWLWDANLTQVMHNGSPKSIFAELFGDPNIDPDKLAELAARRKSILDEVGGEFEGVIGKISGADKLRVEEHLEAIRAIEQTIGNVPSCKPDMASLMLQDSYTPADLPKWMDHMTTLIALGLACDSTRIVTLFTRHGGGGQSFFPWLDLPSIPEDQGSITTEHHAMSHAWPTMPHPWEALVTIHTWFSQQIAMLAGKLAAQQEVGGSVLDNSSIFVVSEIAEGNHSKLNIPFLLLGGMGGAFKTGRHLAFSGDGIPHNRILVSLMQGMGVEAGPSGEAGLFGNPMLGKGPVPGLMA